MPGLILLLLYILPIDFSFWVAKILILIYLSFYPEIFKKIKKRFEKLQLKEFSKVLYANTLAKNLIVMLHHKEFEIKKTDFALKRFIGVSFHYGVWELIPLFFKNTKSIILIQPQRSLVLNKFLKWWRSKIHGFYTFSLKELLKYFKKGYNIGFMLEGSKRMYRIKKDIPFKGYFLNAIPYKLQKKYNEKLYYLFAEFKKREVMLSMLDEKKVKEKFDKNPYEWIAWVD